LSPGLLKQLPSVSVSPAPGAAQVMVALFFHAHVPRHSDFAVLVQVHPQVSAAPEMFVRTLVAVVAKLPGQDGRAVGSKALIVQPLPVGRDVQAQPVVHCGSAQSTLPSQLLSTPSLQISIPEQHASPVQLPSGPSLDVVVSEDAAVSEDAVESEDVVVSEGASVPGVESACPPPPVSSPESPAPSAGTGRSSSPARVAHAAASNGHAANATIDRPSLI
jgi:hypothetical protein